MWCLKLCSRSYSAPSWLLLSRMTCTAAERNYVVIEQDLLASVEALQCYLLSGKQFNLVTSLQTQPILSWCPARGSDLLQRFDCGWLHRFGRPNDANPLTCNSSFKHLNALLAVDWQLCQGFYRQVICARVASYQIPHLILQLLTLATNAERVHLHLLLLLTPHLSTQLVNSILLTPLP